MFFNNWAQRKLVTQLQPWLRDDPQLELKLGFFRSNGILNNITFNTSALNELLDDPSKFCFKEVTVENLSLQFSPFSSAAFILVVRGLRVVLSLGEERDERRVKWRRKPRDTMVDERNKILEEIDPEGCAFHGAIKRISDITTRTWRTSLLNTLVSHCQLQLLDVHVVLRSPSQDPLSCSLYMQNLEVKSEITGRRCFTRQLTSSFFLPSEESSFNVDINSFEIRLNSEKRTSCVVPATSMSVLVNMNHFHFISFCFRVPALKYIFSPQDLSVMLPLYGLYSKESKHFRPGRQLWNIVASRINFLLLSPKLAWIQLFRVMCLWLRYVKIYQSTLLLVGYPTDEIMRRSAVLMLRDASYSRSVKSRWKMIDEIQNALPVEAIISARRIIRARVSSSGLEEKESFDEFVAKGFFSKLRQLLVLILSTAGSIFYLVTRFLYNFFDIFPRLGSVRDVWLLQQCISLDVQEIAVSVSPDYGARQPVSRKADNDVRSFHFSVDGFSLRYTANVSEQSLIFVSGCLKVLSSFVPKADSSSSLKGHQEKDASERQIIMWSDPAQIYTQESNQCNATDDIHAISTTHLERLLGKLWLNWKDSFLKPEGENRPNVLTPWILCDVRSFLMDHGLKSRFWNCSLVVGKLNSNLEYFSIASMALLFRQIQCALLSSHKRSKTILLQTPNITIQDPLMRDWRSKFRSFSNKVKADIINMLPEKHVEIGVLIEGPHIQISLLNDRFNAETTEHQLVTHLSFDICNIEFLATPDVEENFGLLSESILDKGLGYHGLDKLQEIDTPNLDNQDYSCQGKISVNLYLKVNGLKVYFEKPSENKKSQVVALSPITTQLCYVRKDHHSFGSSIVALSASFRLVAAGFCSLIFLDELYIFTKIIGVFYESLPSRKDGSSGGRNYEDAGTVNLESESQEMFYTRSNKAFVVTNTRFNVSSTCEIESFDIVLHDSRKNFHLENKIDTIPINRGTGIRSPLHDLFGNGIYFTVQHSTVNFLFRGGNIDVVIDISGVQSIIFRFSSELEKNSDKSELKNILSSLNFLTEASVSHSRLSLRLQTTEEALPSENLYTAADASGSHGKHVLGDSSLLMDTEKLGDQWLFVTIIFSGLYVAGCQIKDVLANGNNLKKLNILFSVGGELQKIACQSKGGFVILEATSAAMFTECFISYYNRIIELWLDGRSSGKVKVPQYSKEKVALDAPPDGSPQKALRQGFLWYLLKEVSVSLLHLSLILVARDESGRLRELLFEVDLNFNLESSNTIRKVLMDIVKLSMLSRFLCGAIKDKDMVVQKVPPFPVMPVDSSSKLRSKISSPSFQHEDGIASSSMSIIPGLKNSYRSPLNYILEDLQCSIAIEKPVTREHCYHAYSTSIWAGNGCISGLDMTLSLSEIQMMLSAYESFSETTTKEETYTEKSMSGSYNQDGEESIHEMVADGTIVAIQDTDQHMYIVVGGAESRYDVAGTIHYSLMGERSLFRVKYHYSRWKSQVQYFSLISLYAKDGDGESLRLNCNARSRLVDISCPNDSASTLWRILPFKPDAYEDATELESFHSLSKRTFQLVNKKNDCAVAFTDGVLEFVGKPGNLFKWKVIDAGSVSNNLLPNKDLMEGTSIPTVGSRELLAFSGTGTNQQTDPNDTNVEELRTPGYLPRITVTVDKVTLTIVHELSDTEEKSPLLQGSITPNQVTVQISNSKVRFMSTFEVAICSFDAHRNSWCEFIQPIEVCTFYCFKFLNQIPENSLHRVPSHLYAKIREVAILVTELSLDIILFVIGKLDLAGPYAVKGPMVLANCCKVDNQSDLPLLCQFYDNQDASVSARQSTAIFLRHLALANQPPEAYFFSVQLHQGSLSTSPFHLSLLEARQFAWRTRIVSSQDSKSFPGPFIVIEISRRIKDGLSIAVSPLLRIHNETDFTLELRFQRPNHEGEEYASLMLKAGDVIDDSIAAFSSISLSGGLRKALTSLCVGNYLFSFRPDFDNGSNNISTVEWSDDLKGGKPVRLSGIFDKLSYQVRKAFSADPLKVSISSASCTLKSDEGFVNNIHFLIQTVGKGIPVINPDNFGNASGSKTTPVAMQEQKEVFVLPTVQVSNLLCTEIHVNLTDTDPHNTTVHDNPWNHATIPCGSAVKFYANPETMIFVVTLTSFGSSSRPVNSSDWVRKLQKKKDSIHHLDVELEFGGGKYFAMLRLSRGLHGTLKAVIFTSYALQNTTNTSLFCVAANQKPSPRIDTEISSSGITPDLGSYLPPNSITSWFLKCHKLIFKLLEEKALEAQLDLDALSGLTEIDLEVEETFGSKDITRLGVSLRASITNDVSSQIVYLSPRYVVSNESEENISIRQCYIEDMEEVIVVNSKQRIALKLKTVVRQMKETNVVENLLRKHTNSENDLPLFFQFQPNEIGYGWSGPICVASLGRFFLKFRKSLEFTERHVPDKNNLGEFAAVHVVEEGSTIVLHFYRPPHTNLPYRIENSLRGAPVTYYQKGSSEPETLGAEASTNYVWDDLTLPHKLVIQLDDVHVLREINLDKVRAWKPIYRNKLTGVLGFHFPLARRPEDQKRTINSQLVDSETVKVGYEVYAEGVTRVLRICEFSDSHKVTMVARSSTKVRLRISYLAVHLLEHAQQEIDLNEPSSYAPIIITRLERLNWDSMFTDEHKYNQIRLQSFSVDEKWAGAPFAAMLRRHQSEKSDTNYILYVAIVSLPMSSGVKQVEYLSIVLQPLNLNLDEETLMKIVPFWRSSLSTSNTPRQQYYFDHFEIHPIKIVASFLPGDSLYSYSSTQETLRSLLHSVIKIPEVKNKTVELNGVLVTHALITLRELAIKCAQHYSWYSMRAIYLAKGSTLLPPAFASIFDDLASSSLDVFFDPSSGLLNLPGVTLGTLKLLSKYIDNKGFSGTKRYFGDLGKTLKTAGSNIIFAAVTEISDSVLKGAETTGVNGMVNGFRQGILKLAMEPAVLSSAFMEGGPDRKIKLDRSPGVDELYIEGYLQAMLDTMYKQEYLRVRVIENQVILKNLPPSSSLIDEIMGRVKDFLASKALLKGGSASAHSLRHIRGEREWRIGPTVLTLCEHLFVSFAIQMLRKRAGKVMSKIKWKDEPKGDEEKAIVPRISGDEPKMKVVWRWGIGKFVFSGIVAYIDGRLCRNIPHPIARRIVSGFLLSFLDQSDDETK